MNRFITFPLAFLALMAGCNSSSCKYPHAHIHRIYLPADPIDPPPTNPVVAVCPMPLPDPEQPTLYYTPLNPTFVPQTSLSTVYEIYEYEPTYIYVDSYDYRPYHNRPQPGYHNPPPHRPDPTPPPNPKPNKPPKPVKPQINPVPPAAPKNLPPIAHKAPSAPPTLSARPLSPPPGPLTSPSSPKKSTVAPNPDKPKSSASASKSKSSSKSKDP